LRETSKERLKGVFKTSYVAILDFVLGSFDNIYISNLLIQNVNRSRFQDFKFYCIKLNLFFMKAIIIKVQFKNTKYLLQN